MYHDVVPWFIMFNTLDAANRITQRILSDSWKDKSVIYTFINMRYTSTIALLQRKQIIDIENTNGRNFADVTYMSNLLMNFVQL